MFLLALLCSKLYFSDKYVQILMPSQYLYMKPRASIDVIKLKWGHTGLEQALTQ